MKYIGNKTRLISFIEDCMKEKQINYQNQEVVDLFSGSGSVSEFFLKNNCKVYSCDNMNYAIAEQYRKLYFRKEPTFEEIEKEVQSNKLDDVLKYLNSLSGGKGYFYDNYCEEGSYQRRYFTVSNAMKIDAIREKIENWKTLLPVEKYQFLLGILMNEADFVSNTAGTYGAYLKIWRSMALKELIMQKPEFIQTGEIELFTDDVIHFTEKMKKVDIVYLDPPYNTRQYAANFHVLESIVVYDKQELNGKTGLREYSKQRSNFSIKANVEKEFEKLILQIKASWIVMSYSTEGILERGKIEEILAKKGIVTTFDKNYRRFKTNAWTDKNTNLKELLFICECN